jgi:hypothetical protein
MSVDADKRKEPLKLPPWLDLSDDGPDIRVSQKKMEKRIIWGIECGTAVKAKVRRQEVLEEGYKINDFKGGFYWGRQGEGVVFLNLYSTSKAGCQRALEIIDDFALEYGDFESRPVRLKRKLTPEQKAAADAFRHFNPYNLYSEDDLREIRDMCGVGERRWF